MTGRFMAQKRRWEETMEYDVRRLREDDIPDWDRLVEESPQGTVFHSSPWLTTCAKVLPGKHEIIGCYKGEELLAGCPIRSYNVGPFKISRYFSNFLAPYNGVVIKPLAKETKLRNLESFNRTIINALSDYFHAEGFSFVSLVNSPSLIDVRPFERRGWTGKITYTYYLSLENPNFEESFSRLVRRNIKKAKAERIEVARSKDVGEYLKLLKMTLKRHRSSTLRRFDIAKNFLEEITTILFERSLGELWLARTSSGETASGEILLFDKKRVYWWSAANDPRFYETGAPSYLKLVMMEELRNRFTEIDMVEADTPGIADFKAGFNPQIVPHYIVEKSSNLYNVARVIHRNIYWAIKKFTLQ
jgi:hypothetical protein